MENFEVIATIRRDKDNLTDNNHFPEMVEKLFNQGVSKFRINLAKFNTEYFSTIIEDIKNARDKVDGNVYFILDAPFPGKKSRIRINKKTYINTGQYMKVFSSGMLKNLNDFEFEVSTPLIGNKMKVKDRVLYGDGTVCFEVDDILDEDTVVIRALNSGYIENAKALNFSNSIVRDDEIFKYLKYMAEAVSCEFLAFSFIENAMQLKEIKNGLSDLKCKIISKVENEAGIANIGEICDYSDAVMLGRGDLGFYSDISQFGISQEKVINTCREKGKKVWLATDFLSSMENRIFPTRAELMDVYYAKKSKADGIIITYGVVRSKQCNNVINIIKNQKLSADNLLN